MNKKIVLLPLVAFSLVLGGCAKPSSSSEAAFSSSSSSQSTSTSADKTPMEKLAAYFAQLEGVNCTMKVTVANTQSFTTYYYDMYGFYSVGATVKGGILANGTQGLFDFDYDSNGDVVLGQPEGKETAVSVAYTTPDILTYASDYFAYAGTGLSFSLKKDEAGTFNSIGTADNLISLIGMDAEYKDQLQSVNFVIEDSLAKSTFTLAFTKFSLTIDFSDIGSTSNSHYDAYMKNPKTVTAPTDFTADFKTGITTLFGSTAVVPFPADATFLFRDDLVYDSDDKLTGLAFTEYSGDIRANYGTALTTAGYTAGDDDETYLFRIAEAGEKSDGTFIKASLSYDEDYEYTEVKFEVYTAPKTYSGTDFTTINSLLMVFNSKNLVNIPLLTASADVTKTTTGDSALAKGGLLDAFVKASIADETKATAYGTAYIDLLTKAGFDTLISGWSSSGIALYSRGDATVFLEKGTDSQNAYDGTMTIAFAYNA
jgi:hypothetical protein